MRRIALVTPILPVPHDMTRGRYIHETARSLAKIAEVRVFFEQPVYPRIPGLAPRSSLHADVGADYKLDDLDVQAFGYPAIPGLTRAFNGWLAQRQLLPRVRAFKPDLVLAYWVYPDGYAALLTARKLGLPAVVCALGSDIHVRSGVNTALTRKTIAGIDALLTVSETMRQSAIREFGARPEKTHTIINGYNTSVFRPLPQAQMRAQFGIPADARMAVYVGRFVEAKGMRELVSAFTRLARDDAKLRLALVGDGVMREELSALVRDSGYADRVHMPGGLPPEQVAQWIAAADLLTLPSWSEGYPNVVVEALACGRPVVATDVGGTHEIVNANNGLLIAPRDAQVLADALRAALDAQWDHAAIAAAMQRTWDDVAAETLAVCEPLIAANQRTR